MTDVDETMQELIGFISKDTRLDVRRAALQYIVGISGALDGSAGKAFMASDVLLGKVYFQLSY